MTQAALDQFSENVKRVRHLGGVVQAFQGLTTGAIDFSDVLRAQLVLIVSALDQFVHEFVRLGMLEVQKGVRAPTDAHLSFKVPLAATKLAIQDATQVEWLNDAVKEAHSWLTFQQPDKIANAIRLVSGVELWNTVATELGVPAANVKAQLKLIVERRNKIAHEADIDPANPPFRWPIDDVSVREAVDFVESVCYAIHKCAT